MRSSWEWTKPLWETHFSGVGGEEGRAFQVSDSEFERIYSEKMQEHFPDEVFFSMRKLVDSACHERRDATEKLTEESLPRFFGILELKGETAAVFSGCAFSARAWRMWATVVAPPFRRQGIYTRILQGHLGYAKDLGFDIVRSEHALNNNPILIAKLKAGFHVSSLEVDAQMGPSLILRYYLHPEQQKAFEFRCGIGVMTPAMLDSGNAAMRKLAAQMVEAKEKLES